ncbi:pentapeptide repeat-containing protein [Leptolyngbya sp. AN03gr2]|uniref:pentapeptide repeat-containing protein n=1 Tax=unclassified Leptolyngbya TaxID=2650499 RepID=UPI003D30FC0D
MAIINEEIKARIEQHQRWIQSNGKEGAIADLRNANLSFTNLSSVDLRNANLRNANLHHADLSSANLSSANLSFTDLSSANLSSADLHHANLSFANLSFTNLSSANLHSANLKYADLSSADLDCANLSAADLHYAIGNMREVKSINFELVSVVWYCDEGEIMVCMSSQRKSLQEWKTLDREIPVVQDGDPNRWRHLAPILWQLIEASPPDRSIRLSSSTVEAF